MKADNEKKLEQSTLETEKPLIHQARIIHCRNVNETGRLPSKVEHHMQP